MRCHGERSVRPSNIRPVNKGQQAMSRIGKKADDAKSVKNTRKDDGKLGQSPPGVSEDDDAEDGDMATPKRDRDDEQQGL
jgi:hypothetical protein